MTSSKYPFRLATNVLLVILLVSHIVCHPPSVALAFLLTVVPVPVPVPTPAPSPVPTPKSWPKRVVGLYLLIADDDWPYQSETEWVPTLPEYMYSGPNVLWLAFVHPGKMPALPPAMQWISQNRPEGTLVIPSIGGQSYSDSASWPWLDSVAAAEAMAAEVVQWKTKYGVDGIDLDAEANQAPAESFAFIKKLKELDPTFIVNQPVFGYPQVTIENYVVNHAFANASTSPVDSIGVMVYQGTGSLQYVDNYLHGSKKYAGFPITVDVPSRSIVVGAGGQASAATITSLAQAAFDQDLGGIMVWYASVKDSATGQVGNQYSGGSMDSSIQSDVTQATWKKALDIMNGVSTSVSV